MFSLWKFCVCAVCTALAAVVLLECFADVDSATLCLLQTILQIYLLRYSGTFPARQVANLFCHSDATKLTTRKTQ